MLYNLNEIDFKILNKIYKYCPIYSFLVFKSFKNPKYTFEHRLKKLEELGLIEITNKYRVDETFILSSKEKNILVITEKGKAFILDFKNKKSSIFWDKILNSFIFPLIVSLLTALITTLVVNSIT